ncbi:hypothetical protein LINGRAHAP2_LOCUS5093 [Linum grandiflorum]
MAIEGAKPDIMLRDTADIFHQVLHVQFAIKLRKRHFMFYEIAPWHAKFGFRYWVHNWY